MSKKAERVSLESYKGVRDFPPKEQFIQNALMRGMRLQAERFGYQEYSASILEPSELYRGKTSEEIVNEQTYTFRDRGDRDVTLRPEMTPTVARMIAKNRHELSFPVRWYSVQNVFRYERPQKGRLREHWQLNCDIFGSDSIEADIEVITLAHSILTSFGAKESDFEIRINSRALLTQKIGNRDLIRLLDRKEKMSHEEFLTAWKALAGTEPDLEIEADESINALLSGLQRRGITNARFAPTLTRGFDYYTGIVFEVFDTDPENKRSIFGGGRYDNLLEMFGEKPIPAAGFGLGDVTLRDFLESRGLIPTYRATTDLYIGHADEAHLDAAIRLATTLRTQGMRIEVDISHKKVGDQIKTADKHGIPYFLCVGEKEMETGIYALKNLSARKEMEVTAENITAHIEKTS